MEGTFVKIDWGKTNDLWSASLLTATDNGYNKTNLRVGEELDLEITDQRRCIGYHSDIGERNPCPEHRELESGSQCMECRKRDIYTGYREGREGVDVEDVGFSVYLAQCGNDVKVGVTRTSKLERRWVEQGADYAAQIKSDLDSRDALEMEDEISSNGVKERIRKEAKLNRSQEKLNPTLERLGLDGEVVDLGDKTIYPDIEHVNLSRSGRLVGELHSVKGQIISNGSIGMAMSSGKTLVKPRQSGLNDYRE